VGLGVSHADSADLTEPLFSIVIPCYNQGAFLHEALASVVAQTLSPHEVIVIDDGSTDPYTIETIDHLCQAPIHLVRQANRGLAGARNSGIREATGDWILPLDADDQLTPDALACFARAIAGEPEIDLWYPDVQHFGLREDLWTPGEFCHWRMLTWNLMVCSTAIHHRVFDAGLHFNERMRDGYEDWEFFIHATCERGFRAKALKAPVFRYRKWGHTMITDASERHAELWEQIRRERPIYRAEARLQAYKREASPYFAVATRGPTLGQALEAQEFNDFRVIDEADQVIARGDLSVFWRRPGHALLVSLSDQTLAAALAKDPFLLEKLADLLEAHAPALVWLIGTADPGSAYPGATLDPSSLTAGTGRAIGFVAPLHHFFKHPTWPSTAAGLVEDLQRFYQRTAPQGIRYLIVGAAPSEAEGYAPPRPAPDTAVQTRRTETAAGALRRLLDRIGRRLRGAHQPFTRSSMPPKGPPAQGMVAHRQGPLDPSQARRERSADRFVANDPPRFRPPIPSTPGLLIATPSIVYGGVSRAVLDLLHGLNRVAPRLPRYLVTTRRERMVWADQLLPHVTGVFSVADRPERDRGAALVHLTERLNVGTLLIAGSRSAYDALPHLRKTRRFRVVAQLHGFDHQAQGGPPGGDPGYAASRYNNLIDAYASTSSRAAEALCTRCYVSPSKVRVVRLGVDLAAFSPARRRRLAGHDRRELLWLGHMCERKDPLMLLEVAQAWKDRHGVGRLHFVVAGSGPLAGELERRRRTQALADVLTLVGPVDEPQRLYQAADAMILTSKCERIPLVVYEAMAAGLPLVTPFTSTAIPEVLDGDDAVVVSEPAAPADYVSALERMLGDPAAARARGERIAEKSGHYSMERYAREMLAVLDLAAGST
jgi:glycosyltransferase involved in cell wall biosynthesis